MSLRKIVGTILLTAFIVVIIIGVVLLSIFLQIDKNYCVCDYYASTSICTEEGIKNLSSRGDGTEGNPYIIEDSTLGSVCIKNRAPTVLTDPTYSKKHPRLLQVANTPLLL